MVQTNGTAHHSTMNGTETGGSKPSHQATNGTNGHTTQNGSLSSQACIDLERDYSAHNYHPMPVVFSKAKGARVWNPEGKEYIDCLSAYSAVNQVGKAWNCLLGVRWPMLRLIVQGHCHSKIVDALVQQAQKLTLSSRAFHSDNMGPYAKKVTELTG